MAKIATIFKRGIGDCEIHISIKTGLFDVRPLDKEAFKKIKSVHHFPDVKMYADAIKQIDEMNKIFLSEFLLSRKVIIIQLKTSVSDRTVDNEWLGKIIGKKLTDDKITHGQGFIIEWCIAEEYKLDLDIREYEKTLYKIIEVSPNHSKQASERVDTLHQLIFGGGEKRIITYREDLHIWLKSLDNQIQEFLNKINSFFDVDSTKFLDNFEKQQFRIGS